jgi:hypothetical protein
VVYPLAAAASKPVLEDLLDAMAGVTYAVDAENRVIAVGRRQWDRFAIGNGAPELCADSIIGRNLFEFVSGSDAQQAYRDLAARIILAGEPVLIAVRCDGPGVVRELRLSIAPLRLEDKGPGLLFQAQIGSGTVRSSLDIFDFKALLSALKQGPDLPIVAMCSFCQRLRQPGAGDDDWVSAEKYYRLGGTSRVRISHGLCADCDAVRFPER